MLPHIICSSVPLSKWPLIIFKKICAATFVTHGVLKVCSILTMRHYGDMSHLPTVTVLYDDHTSTLVS